MPARLLKGPHHCPAVVVLLGMLVSPDLLAGSGPVPTLDPARVGWSEIRMTASRLFMTATADATLRLLPTSSIRDQLWPPPLGHAVMPGDSVLEVSVEIGGLGRRSQVTLWMDPHSGAALQRHQQDLEGRQRFRTYRFTDQGAYHWTRWPTAGERARPPGEWTRTEAGLRPYAPAAAGRIIVEPTGLLYAAAAAAISRPGEELELIIFQRRSVQQVSITVAEITSLRVAHDEFRGDSRTRRTGLQPALRLTLRGETMDEAEDELELFGLRGALELYLDPTTRTPLQLSGDVKVVGRVNLRLAAVRLAGLQNQASEAQTSLGPARASASTPEQRNAP